MDKTIFPVWERALPQQKALFEAWERQIAEIEGLGMAFPPTLTLTVLGYRVLHGSAPRYLGPLTRVADVPGRRNLRSAATNRLIVPSVKL